MHSSTESRRNKYSSACVNTGQGADVCTSRWTRERGITRPLVSHDHPPKACSLTIYLTLLTRLAQGSSTSVPGGSYFLLAYHAPASIQCFSSEPYPTPSLPSLSKCDCRPLQLSLLRSTSLLPSSVVDNNLPNRNNRHKMNVVRRLFLIPLCRLCTDQQHNSEQPQSRYSTAPSMKPLSTLTAERPHLPPDTVVPLMSLSFYERELHLGGAYLPTHRLTHLAPCSHGWLCDFRRSLHLQFRTIRALVSTSTFNSLVPVSPLQVRPPRFPPDLWCPSARHLAPSFPSPLQSLFARLSCPPANSPRTFRRFVLTRLAAHHTDKHSYVRIRNYCSTPSFYEKCKSTYSKRCFSRIDFTYRSLVSLRQ